MDSHARVPLRDQTNDLSRTKKLRLTPSGNLSKLTSQYQQQQQQPQQQQQRDVVPTAQKRRPLLEGDEFKEWQAIWRRTMKESVIYFYGDDGNNVHARLETEKLKLALKQLGATISSFFDSDVTIIISRKLYDPKLEYRLGHVFHSASLNGLKVWSYEKVFRFLKNLGEPTAQIKSTQTQDLSVLLTQERLHGPIDRDFTLKRDDFHYFRGLYFYCYDLRQVYRPVAVREWMCKNNQDEDSAGFPQLYASTNGRCPYQDDPVNESTTKKRLQRLKYFEDNKEFRQKLIKLSKIKKKRSCTEIDEDSESEIDDSFYKSSSSSCCSPNDNISSDVTYNITNKDTQVSLMAAPPAPLLKPTTPTKKIASLVTVFNHHNHHLHEYNSNDNANFQSNYPNSNQNTKFFEIQASGMNNQSTAISQNQSQQEFGNNGLAPSKAEVLTKSFKNLNRKVTRANKSASLKEVIDLKKKREELKLQDNKENETGQERQVIKPKRKREEPSTAGYCESCRLKYDSFNQHINSAKHRSFAMKDSNFEQIDNLIRKIHDTNILHS